MASRKMNGEGTIKKVGTGAKTRWRITIMVGTDEVTGKSIRKTATFKTLSELKSWRNEILRQKTGVPIQDNSKLTLGKFLDLWLEHKKAVVKETSYWSYFSTLKVIKKDIGHLKLGKLTRLHLQEYADRLLRERAYKTVRRYFATLSVAFKYGILQGYLQINPCDGILFGKAPKRQIQIFTDEEFAVFLKAIEGNRFENIYRLAMTGLRKSELMGLQIEDIDFEKKTLHVCHELMSVKGGIKLFETTKTSSSDRYIPLNDKLIDLLKTIIGDRTSGHLFVWPDGYAKGKPISPIVVYDEYKRILKANGLPLLRFHALRHMACSRMISNKIDPKTAAAILGHSNAKITLDVYTHTNRELQAEAIDILAI